MVSNKYVYFALVPIFIAIAVLGFLYYDLTRKFENIPTSYSPTTTTTGISSCTNCVTQSDMDVAISRAVAGISTNAKDSGKTTVIAPTAVPTSGPSLVKLVPVFISLGGPYNTQSTDWVDVPNEQLSINFASDYGSNAKVIWDAILKVDQGNGAVYARLFDVTNGIAVEGSEINTTSSTLTLVSSGNLKFVGARNLYRVQIKSLTTYTAFIDSARIKIYY